MLPIWIRACRLIFGVTALAAVFYNINHFDDPNLWTHFTYESNLLGGVVLILGATVFGRYRNPAWWDVIRGIAVIALLLTGIVYATLLDGLYNPFTTSEYTWASSVMHQLMPIVLLLDIILVPLGPRTPRWHVFYYLIFPLVYLGLTLLRGENSGYYPYDFLDPNEYDNGYTGVLIICGALLLAFVIIGLGIIAYSRIRRTPGRLMYG